MKDLTVREKEIIAKELNAFNYNFENVVIKKDNKTFFVYLESDILSNAPEWHNQYKYYADNVYIIKGWLYGCVQAGNFKKKDTSLIK